MAVEITTLQLIFRTATDRTRTLSIPDPDLTVTGEDIGLAMDNIISKDIFNDPLVSKYKARIVTRSVEEFDV